MDRPILLLLLPVELFESGGVETGFTKGMFDDGLGFTLTRPLFCKRLSRLATDSVAACSSARRWSALLLPLIMIL
jgi:hypothetical protein